MSPKFRLALALLGGIGSVVLLDNWPALHDLVGPLERLTATTTFFIINATGLPIAVSDTVLSHPTGFRVAISYGCTPLVPAIFLVLILTLGLSMNWRARLAGLGSGIALLTILNLFRVIALYYVGVTTPETFTLAHEWLGQGVIVLGTAAVALYWIDASTRNQRHVITT